jgi:hypothetical protein
LHRAQLQLKQAKRKDLYKILGVARDANEEEIKKVPLVALSSTPAQWGS